jgi:uncharacterized protein
VSRMTLIVLAKEPRPGHVKTRLVPPLTHADAARLAAAALQDTLAVVSRTSAARRVLAFAGDPSQWRLRGWTVTAQPPGGLDVRIAAALRSAQGPALLVGMDTPQLQPEHLRAFDPLRFDAAIGPAPDGGYWAIGLRNPALADVAVRGVPMSTERTAEHQIARLTRLGLRVQTLPPLTDVDTFADAERVAAQAAGTRFAAALATLPVTAR